MAKLEYSLPGIADEMFIRGKVPMTKSEVRAITMSKLRLEEDSKLLDIGAGSGSVSVEAALIAKNGQVCAIEKNPDGIDLIHKNSNKFGVSNIKVIHGKAIEDLPEEKFDRVFIGGTGGQMAACIAYADERLTEGGRIVINLITIENLYKGLEALKLYKFEEIETIQVQINRGRPIGSLTLMDANNPIYIISAKVGEKSNER